MVRPNEMRKYDFRYEDTTNSVRVNVYLPLEQFEDKVLMQHAGRNGLDAGTHFTVHIMDKNRSRVYYQRTYMLSVAEEIPAVLNELGERGRPSKRFELYAFGDWLPIVPVENPTVTTDAPRQTETYVPDEAEAIWNVGANGWTIRSIATQEVFCIVPQAAGRDIAQGIAAGAMPFSAATKAA